jgi:hypothetical protein
MSLPINKVVTMARKKTKTPKDIIEAIRKKQYEIDDLLWFVNSVRVHISIYSFYKSYKHNNLLYRNIKYKNIY